MGLSIPQEQAHVKKIEREWSVYRTRFLIKAKKLTKPFKFVDALGREHHGKKGDYLMEWCDGMDSFACAVSIALQHGVPLKLLCEKFAHTRFEPSGWSKTPEIGFAKSIMDYIFRWLQIRFLTGQQQLLFENLRPRLNGVSTHVEGLVPATSTQGPATNSVHAADALASIIDLGDAPSCHVCGSIMVRNGSCYKCMSCGSTSGCS